MSNDQLTILEVVQDLRQASGVTVFVENLTRQLNNNGIPTKILTLEDHISINDIKGYSIVHIHGLWSPKLHRVAKFAKERNIPIVWSPHGMLTPWAMSNKKWKKFFAWWLYQRWDLMMSDMIHATAMSEVEDVLRMGLKKKVSIAPLGVNACACVKHGMRADGKRVLLFVSRIQKKKGLENLVSAWAKLTPELKRMWIVRIVGPDQEGHTYELKQLCTDLGTDKDFEFAGPKYGVELAQEYASADLFVLPTHSENFGSVVIEALAHGVPVICTKGAPWEELKMYACGWWIDIGVEPLANALQEAMSMSDEDRQSMGSRGRKLVDEKYTWDAVVKAMVKGYKEILNGRA